MLAILSVATPAAAGDATIDVSPAFTNTTCAKMARHAELGKWTKGKNPGVLFSVPRVHTINIAPESAPEWVRDMLNGVKRQTTVVVSAESANMVDARCYYRNVQNTWKPLGTAKIPGILQLDYPVDPLTCCETWSAPKFERILTETECATLVSTVASTNSWRPQRLSSGEARSVSRSFVGLEDFWNNSTLKKAGESTAHTQVRLEGINTYFVINARESGRSTPELSAKCFLYDSTFSIWFLAASTYVKVSTTLPKAS
jgi:hypothetical protein